MTKQEGVREGLAKVIWLAGHPDTEKHWQDAPQEVIEYWLDVAERYMHYLHSQGVVIKSDIPTYASQEPQITFIEPLIEE